MRKLAEEEKDKGKNMIVSQSDGFLLVSPVGGVNGVVSNPLVNGIPQIVVDAMNFKLVAGLIKHAGLSKGCYTVNLYGCVGSDDKAHFDVTNGFMSDAAIADGGYYHLARYEVLNQPPPFKKLYYVCNWSHSEVASRVPNRVMPNSKKSSQESASNG